MASSRPPQSQPLTAPSLPGNLDSVDGQSSGNPDNRAGLINAAAVLAAAELLNKHNAHTNTGINLAFSATDLTNPDSSASAPSPLPDRQIQFRSTTIAPSPPSSQSSTRPATSQKLAELSTDLPPAAHHHHQSPYSANPLRLRTDVQPPTPILTTELEITRPQLNLQRKTSATSLKPVSRTPSLKTNSLATVFGTASAASSTVASPVISAMPDVTPLPSPLLSGDSPGPWKKLIRPPSRDAGYLAPIASDSALVTSAGESVASAMASQNKRKAYVGLTSGTDPAETRDTLHSDRAGSQMHTPHRSASEYVPNPFLPLKRMVTVSGSHANNPELPFDGHMRREPHLSEARGLTPTPIEKPPTPPPSESSLTAVDSSSVAGSGSSTASKKDRQEYFEAYGRRDKKRRRWRAVKMLGQGTFSRVMLATSQVSSSGSDDEEYSSGNSARATEPQTRYDRRTLVAVKVCEHGPRGGASEDRVEMSLKRELEIMQCIHHPSLAHLKAWNIEPTRAILVLSYCPGGDLFDVASTHRNLLTPSLLRRIFSELVGAVSYLHGMKIVHRDIKLENVLVNLPASELGSASTDWATYPYSVVTLTDLGLSRRIADDEKLETRCGSDDYAAPEVIMGQPYDGRATDAWSLGVLLYALLEGRLPFDPLPGVGDHAMQMRMRSRTSHRIARVEWRWVEYGVQEGEDGEGDHEADLAHFESQGLTGAMEVVEGLLKRSRSRWPLTKVAATKWVAEGVQVEGGIKFRDEEEGEEVL